jgi:rhodanese-related sulfurtransferase
MLLRQLKMARVSVAKVAALVAAGTPPVIIDVRPLFQQNATPMRIPGARTIHDEEVSKADRLQPVIVYWSRPDEVSAAVKTLQLRRFKFANVRPLKGGLAAWRAAGHPVEAIGSEPAEETATTRTRTNTFQGVAR